MIMRRFAFASIALATLVAAPPVSARGHVYMSLMGEPFRTSAAGKDPFDQWFELADADGDGSISRTEFLADAKSFFAALDGNGDKVVDADEMALYEQDAPARTRAAGGGAAVISSARPKPTSSTPVREGDVAVVASGPSPSSTRVHPGGGIDVGSVPQPVAMADLNLDRRVTIEEFTKTAARRFVNYDTDGDSKLSRKELR